MRETVIFRDRQEVQATDLMEVQDFVRASIDDLIRDAVTNGKGFAGFEVTQDTSSSVTVAAGRLYSGGAMYFRDTVTSLPLASFLPLVTKKKVAIVVWGMLADQDTEPRDFLVNVETNETEPQVVAMHSARTVQMQAIAGIESPDPQPPANLDTNVLPVAYVTLSTSGIVAIEPAVGNRLPNVSELETLIDALNNWKTQVDPRIATLVSEIAEIKRKLGATSQQHDVFRIAADMARVKEALGLPATYAEYGADHFLDTGDSDTGNLEFLAKVEEGIRFSDEAADEAALAVFNPLDPNIKMSGGLILPKWSHQRRITVDSYASELSIASYGYQTIEMKELTMSRERVRYGNTMTVCTNSNWFRSGQYDPVSRIFSLNGETFEVLDNPDTFGGDAHWVRVRQFWHDTYQEPYWTAVTVPRSITGADVAQTFLNAQDGWMTRLHLWFTRLAGSGNLTVAICELTSSGTPDPNRVICYKTVNYSELRIGWTAIEITPTFLKAGRHYAIRLITNADHWVGMASGNKYSQGTFFYTTDNVFYAGDLTKDLMFAIDFASFASPRVEVQLAPLSLSGGITDIDILCPMVSTNVAKVTFEVQIGGRWRPLDAVTPNLLVGLPPLLPLRAVFNGTTDVHAGLNTVGSRVHISRPRTTFKHISKSQSLAAATQTVHVIYKLEAWNEAHHTLTCNLLTAGGTVSPSTVINKDLGADTINGGRVIERTCLFNLAQPVSSYKVITEGGTTTALDTFHVSERVRVDF